mgnify:CR=1 FL=1
MLIDSNVNNIITAKLLKAGEPEEKVRALKGKEPSYNKQEKEAEAKLTELKAALKEVLKIEKYMNRGLLLEVEDELHIVVAKIVDKESGEVVKQIPLAELIEIAKKIKESGLIVNKEV